MKVLAVIMCAVFLALSVMPCDDNCADEHAASGEEMIFAQDAGAEDHCSPLCVCQCCHINIVLNNTGTISFVSDFSTPKDLYFIRQVQSPASTHWQPPKI